MDVEKDWQKTGVFILTGLLIGAGTEGVNTIQKYFGYLKDAKKADPTSAVEVSVAPTATTAKVGSSLQFLYAVKNTSNIDVEWQVLSSDGGTIRNTGLYTAAPKQGTYQIVVRSKADPTKWATATVTVAP